MGSRVWALNCFTWNCVKLKFSSLQTSTYVTTACETKHFFFKVVLRGSWRTISTFWNMLKCVTAQFKNMQKIKWQNFEPLNLELQAIPYLMLTKHRQIHTSYVNNKFCLKIFSYEKFLCVIKHGKRFFCFRIWKKKDMIH